MEDDTDHDLLIGLVKDMFWLRDSFRNHLKHHWMLEIGLFLLLAGAVASKIWG